jgi:hypothetical protein
MDNRETLWMTTFQAAFSLSLEHQTLFNNPVDDAADAADHAVARFDDLFATESEED